MIEVNGEDVKVGGACGTVLIEEATRAVYGVYLTLKQDLPDNISEHELMIFLLRQIGGNLAHIDTDNVVKHPDGPDDFMNRVFGDLLK